MNYDKFVKILRLTTSSSDGEALNAIRMANTLLKKENLDWDKVIRLPMKLSTMGEISAKRQGSTSYYSPPHWAMNGSVYEYYASTEREADEDETE